MSSVGMISVKRMRVIESLANGIGIDDSILMENAGANAARIADENAGLRGKRAVIFCGTGNNTGDGLVFARHALAYGADVRIYFVKGRGSLKELAMKNYRILLNLKRNGQRVEFLGKVTRETKADVLVDAMLGTGIRGDVRSDYGEAIHTFNSMHGIKISLDCPSGINAETGNVMGAAVEPDITVTFHDRKPGLDRKNSGRIIVAGIGIPEI